MVAQPSDSAALKQHANDYGAEVLRDMARVMAEVPPLGEDPAAVAAAGPAVPDEVAPREHAAAHVAVGAAGGEAGGGARPVQQPADPVDYLQ